MGFKFDVAESSPDTLVSTEGVKEYLIRVKDGIKSRYLKYETWEKELEASASYLTNIHADWKVTGIWMFTDAMLAVKGIDALNKLLTEVQKKTPIDFTKQSAMGDLRKVGFDCTPDMIDNSKYLERKWMKPVKGRKPLKDLGWQGSKAVQFGKSLQTALRNAGTQKAYEAWVTSTVNEYALSNNREKYKTLSKVVKQAQQIVKVRHAMLVDLYKQFLSIKRTI